MKIKPKILVTRKLPKDVETRLLHDYDVFLNTDDSQYSSADIIERAQGVDAILCTPTESLREDCISNLENSVKIISTFSVGYDHIDAVAASRHNIKVTNTPDVLTDATADIALLCMLGAARLAYSTASTLRNGNWKRWTPTQFLGTHMTGKRLGILGMGRIGQAVARRAKGFDMTIHYFNRNELPDGQSVGGIYHKSIESLLGASDFLSINCPLTPETYHLVDEKHINMMPDGAVVVNTARGPVIKDEDLITALKNGKIASAGLDVFEGEPNINPAYLKLDNIFLLPHIGSATIETRNAMGFKALDNLDAFFANSPLPSPVN